ncbi:MAG: SHOCT domain-containing protein [Acidimicrobiales bacterium]
MLGHAGRILVDVLGNGDHMGGWGGAWMWFWGALMMAGAVALVVPALRVGTDPSRRPRDAGESARAILDRRYARGDISTEEYRERGSELR